jgi:hypothetical protein
MLNTYKSIKIIENSQSLNSNYSGLVVDNSDPSSKGRVRVSIPELLGGIEPSKLPWYIVKNGTGVGGNSYSNVLPINSEVTVEFPNNDIYNGIVTYSVSSTPPLPSQDDFTGNQGLVPSDVSSNTTDPNNPNQSGSDVNPNATPTNTKGWDDRKLLKIISSKEGDTGTIGQPNGNAKSYGEYQWDSRTGGAYLNEFYKTDYYKRNFNGTKPPSSAFDAKWKEMARTDKSNFSNVQYNVTKTTVDKMVGLETLRRNGYDTSNPAIRLYAYDTAINSGGFNKSNKIIIPPGTSIDKQLETLNSRRVNMLTNSSAKGLRDPEVRRSVINRANSIHAKAKSISRST